MPVFAQQEKIPLGIYVHVPFCRSKCQYCDFYSLGGSREKGLIENYLEAVCLHIKEAGALAPGYQVDTVYFGGGTPSFLGADGLVQILNAVRRRFSVSGNGEITFEANPDSVTEKLLKRLRAEGFNRISLGVQSDDDGLLKKLGRPHSYRQAVQAVELARKVGFHNLSLDLMYGLPGQSLTAWEETLEHVLELAPEHMSCYGLKVEEGTPLWQYKDAVNLPDDDAQADMYLSAVRILKEHGYAQYEISNFARPGHASRHNLKYWTLGEYAGFGPGAYSDFGGVRYGYIRDLDRYIAGELVLAESEHIPVSEREMEYIMLRLRTTEGMNIREFENRFRRRFDPLGARLEVYADHGLAQRTEQGWRLTPRGFLVSNQIIGELQEFLNREKLERLRRAQEGDYRVV